MNLQPDIWLLIEVCKKRRTQDGRLSKKKDGSKAFWLPKTSTYWGFLFIFVILI